MALKLSIITSTWNSESTLPATLDSLAAQTSQSFESIVIDGGSTDGTMNIVENSSVVDRWISEEDGGIYEALNKGISMSCGEYIGFLHSDDILASERSLESLINCILDHSPDAIYADLEYVKRGDTKKVVRSWVSGKFDNDKFKWGWMPPHPTFYMKKSLYEKFGLFDLNYRIAADYEAMLRYLYVNKVEPIYIPEVLVKMRLGGMSNRSINNIIQKSMEDIRAMRGAGIPSITGLLGKNFGKIPQFLNLR